MFESEEHEDSKSESFKKMMDTLYMIPHGLEQTTTTTTATDGSLSVADDQPPEERGRCSPSSQGAHGAMFFCRQPLPQQLADCMVQVNSSFRWDANEERSQFRRWVTIQGSNNAAGVCRTEFMSEHPLETDSEKAPLPNPEGGPGQDPQQAFRGSRRNSNPKDPESGERRKSRIKTTHGLPASEQAKKVKLKELFRSDSGVRAIQALDRDNSVYERAAGALYNIPLGVDVAASSSTAAPVRLLPRKFKSHGCVQSERAADTKEGCRLLKQKLLAVQQYDPHESIHTQEQEDMSSSSRQFKQGADWSPQHMKLKSSWEVPTSKMPQSMMHDPLAQSASRTNPSLTQQFHVPRCFAWCL